MDYSKRKKCSVLAYLCLLLLCSQSIMGVEGGWKMRRNMREGAGLFGTAFFAAIPRHINKVTQNLALINRISDTRPEQAEQLARQAYWYSRSIHYYPGMVVALGYLALRQREQGNFDSSLLLQNIALQLTKQCGAKNKAHKIYTNMGMDLFLQGNYEQALDFYYKALNALTLYNLKFNNEDSTKFYRNIAVAWHRLGEPQKVQEALAVLKQLTFRNASALAQTTYYGTLIAVSPELEDKVLLQYYFKLMELSYQYRDMESLIPTLNNLCSYYIRQQQLDSAKIYLDKAFAVIRIPASSTFTGLVLIAIGVFF